ncbi:MAG: isoprenylcysteine carboxylmethyltransferase family protein [Betaproteobacteria bacterium]|nr:isoprenylcysteine carboxylmethyltransferase family protein [Betaproteobacteria bacterium]
MLPPLLYGIAFAVVLLLHWLWPLPVFPHAATFWVGVMAISASAALIAWGAISLRKAGTNINPSLPTTALVASGPFRFSRNPLYVALSLMFVGLSLAVNSLWGVLALFPSLLVMHYGVILREERYLEAKFGESYRQYCSVVRRYL